MHDPLEIELPGYLVYLDVDADGNLQVRVYHDSEGDPVGVLNVDRRNIDHREDDAAIRRRQIAIVWLVEDVLSVRPDLSPAQAWDVLQSCRDHHDCNYGMTWETIDATADACFPMAVP